MYETSQKRTVEEEIIVDRNRNGRIGVAKCIYDKVLYRFRDLIPIKKKITLKPKITLASLKKKEQEESPK